MTKFIVDLWLDGYDSEDEMITACEEFIFDTLDFSASSVKITRATISNIKELLEEMTKGN
jgi:hypothetical protein